MLQQARGASVLLLHGAIRHHDWDVRPPWHRRQVLLRRRFGSRLDGHRSPLGRQGSTLLFPHLELQERRSARRERRAVPRLSTPFISNERVEHEKHSPGPKYLPKTEFREKSIKYSLRPRGRLELDERLRLESGLGPAAYRTRVSRSGGGYIGDAPKYGFRKADQIQRPDMNYRSVPFVSEEHARSENIGIHSPGPGAYTPVSPTGHPGSPIFKKTADRFYTPFEPNRIA